MKAFIKKYPILFKAELALAGLYYLTFAYAIYQLFSGSDISDAAWWLYWFHINTAFFGPVTAFIVAIALPAIVIMFINTLLMLGMKENEFADRAQQ